MGEVDDELPTDNDECGETPPQPGVRNSSRDPKDKFGFGGVRAPTTMSAAKPLSP